MVDRGRAELHQTSEQVIRCGESVVPPQCSSQVGHRLVLDNTQRIYFRTHGRDAFDACRISLRFYGRSTNNHIRRLSDGKSPKMDNLIISLSLLQARALKREVRQKRATIARYGVARQLEVETSPRAVTAKTTRSK